MKGGGPRNSYVGDSLSSPEEGAQRAQVKPPKDKAPKQDFVEDEVPIMSQFHEDAIKQVRCDILSDASMCIWYCYCTVQGLLYHSKCKPDFLVQLAFAKFLSKIKGNF